MRAIYNASAPKRAVNLSLNEDLVAQARNMTNNLSSVVETLLAAYLIREKQTRAAEAKALQEAIAVWNDFADKHGSFADEHSTL